MSNKIKEPKDLGVKIGTPEHVQWQSLKSRTEEQILMGTLELQVNAVVLELAERKIKEEKEKFK